MFNQTGAAVNPLYCQTVEQIQNGKQNEDTRMTSLGDQLIRTACLCLTGLSLMVPSAFAADYNSGVTAKVLKKTSVTGNGQKITYPLTDRAEVTAMTVDLAPDSETGWHKHPVPVYAYVISGDLSVELEDGKHLSFGAGEVVIEVVNTLHNGKNSGTEPVKLAVFYLGAEGTPNVVKPGSLEKSEQQKTPVPATAMDCNRLPTKEEFVRNKLDRETIMKVQQCLKAKGFFNARVDGVKGPLTIAALEKAQANSTRK